ncbi:MAG: glycosyltransferase family 2 protein [bacterium]
MVSVIVPAYYGDAWLKDCLDSLVTASISNLHLILVDNGGNKSISNLDLQQFDFEVLQTSQELGFAEVNNFALLNASRLEKYILFLNQDTISHPGWIDTCVDYLESSHNVGAVSPLYTQLGSDKWSQPLLNCALAETEFKQDYLAGELTQSRYSVELIPAAAMLVRREVLFDVGPFDPLFISYYEDFDLCQRIISTGHTIAICLEARVEHAGGGSANNAARRDKRDRLRARNRVIYRLRWPRGSKTISLAKYLLKRFPTDLLSSFGRHAKFRTRPYLRGHLELMGMLPVLFSSSRQRQHWQRYLESIQWPPAQNSPLNGDRN